MDPPATAASVKLVPGVQWPALGALPRCLALPPLFDRLFSRVGLRIRPLTDDGRLADEAVPTDFQAVDCEPWGRRFLGDLDRFVGAPFASALCGEPVLRDALVQAIGCALTLADAITADLQPLFGAEGDGARGRKDPNAASGLASARLVLRRQLCHELAVACRSVVLVQYDVQASLPWTGAPGLAPSALHGPAAIDDDGIALHFAAARTGLAEGDRFATFVAEVDEPARHRWLGGQLQYTCTHAEFGLPADDVPPGCEAPGGPCFVPLQGTNGPPAALVPQHPGALRVPVPLRGYPARPAILAQAALPTHAHPAGLDEMPLWTYELTCRHEFAAQDLVRLAVDFNTVAAAQHTAPAPAPDPLFDALAQYIAVADGLWALLDPLAKPDAAAGAAQPGLNAACTFADLVAAVAQHWSARLRPAPDEVAPQDGDMADENSLAFDARATYAKDGKTLQGISLKREPTGSGPVDAWPEMDVVLDGGSVALEPQSVTGDTMVYRPPTATIVPAPGELTLRLAWRGLNVAGIQNAGARLLAVRNQDLLHDPLHAGDPTPPTHPRLLLKTAEVGFPSAVTPLLQCFRAQEISGVDAQAALAATVQTLFPPAAALPQLTASWQVSCVHGLPRDGHAVATQPPVQTPVAFFAAQSVDAVVDALAAAVRAWTHEHPAASGDDAWLFGLTLFSALEPAQTPLLRAELLYRPT